MKTRRILLLALVAAFATGALTVGSTPAAAATPCWKRLLNDWFDGRIDKAYPVACYRQAIKNLPEDVQAYSDARDDIERALNRAIRGKGNSVAPGDIVEPTPAPTGTTDEEPDPTETADGDGEAAPPNGDDSDDDSLLGALKPSNADSIPLPLLILAGLALFLLALAGGGFVTRRIQERRVRLSPPPPDEP